MFRVALDQLKLRGGIVRCGACNEIFDGNAALVEPSVSAAGAAIPVLMPAAAMSAGLDLELDLDEVLVRPPKAAPGPEDHAPAPRHAREIDDDEDLHLAIPAVADESERESEREPEPDLEPEFQSDPDPDPDTEPESALIASDCREPAFDMPSEHIVAIALDDLHHFDDEPATPSPLLIDAADPAANAAADRTADDAAAADLLTAAPESALLAAGTGAGAGAVDMTTGASARPGTPTMQDEADVPGDEPEFVRQAERRERTQGNARLAM
ncbi:MAG TPA: MJ0042-type zinc finger domain-containing protein, partial [Pseudoduganella sp.]